MIKTNFCAPLLAAFLLTFFGVGELAIANPAFVQSAYQDPTASQTSVTVTFPAAQTAHDLNVIVVGWEDTSAGMPSVADSNLNSYSLAIGPTQTTGFSQYIYYARDIASGSDAVTVTFPSPATNPDIRVLEYSGLDNVNPLDVAGGKIG